MIVTPTRVVLTLSLLGTIAAVWYWGGFSWWRDVTEDRLAYGVPWGTLLTVAIVVAFYLFAQGGLAHWSDPVTFPFVSWSYFYPLGLLTSGVAHGSPGHIVGNMSATVVFAPVAELVWGHYAPARRDDTSMLTGRRRLRDHPAVRALVIAPAAMFAVAFGTAVFSFGPGLGFSGAVFGLVGFVLVTRPKAGVVAVLVTAAGGTLLSAFTDPIVRAGTSAGAPGPPSWANIAFQAHMLGFLIGVVVGTALFAARDRRPARLAVVGAVVLVGLVQSLWLIAFPASGDVWVLYRGAGVSLVLVLSLLVTVAATGGRRVPYVSSMPSRRMAGAGWLLLSGALYALLLVAIVAVDGGPTTLAVVTVAFVPLALPGAIPIVRSRWGSVSLSARGTGIALVVLFALVVAFPGVIYGPITVDDSSVTNTGEVTVRDYTVTYGENLTSGQKLTLLGGRGPNTTVDGVVVVNEQREIWTLGARPSTLERNGNTTVRVGGLGWRETITANRTGWLVTGNDSVYAVDLIVDGDRTRSFASDPKRAATRIDGYNLSIAPEDGSFAVRLHRNNDTVAATPIPEANGTASLGPLMAVTERRDDTTTLSVETPDGTTSVEVAERENY